jgi:uncharacterized phage protein gp47/JayE
MTQVAPPRIDYTNKDYQSLVSAMLDLARDRLPEWTDHSANDLGVVLTEMFAYMGDVALYYTDRALNEGFLDTAIERRSIVNLLRLLGYELRPPKPASAALTLLFDPAQSSVVPVATGVEFETQIKVDNKTVRFRYVRQPLSINLGALPSVSWTDGKIYRVYEALPVVQVEQAVSQEIVGSSAGTAGQRFRLAKRPLLSDSLIVRVDEGGGANVWEQRDSLLNTHGADLHYAVRRDADEYAWIEFGDDKYGRIPRRGLNNITADYLVGGGAKGNVAPYTITKIVTPIQHLQKVGNRAPATGGADAEAAADAAAVAPRQFRSMDRAVTTQDYESHALHMGVGKARARSPSWNRIELFVAPAGGGYPTDTFKQDLLRYFEQKRMLTSMVDILDPVYVPVFVEGTLVVEPYVFQETARQQTVAAIQDLLSFERRDFQDTLYLSKVYEAIEAVPGISAVNVTRFARADSAKPLPDEGKLEFGWDEIPVAGFDTGINLTAVTGGLGAP